MLTSFLPTSKSIEELEVENAALMAQLQRAEEKINSLQNKNTGLLALELIEKSLRQSEQRLELELADTKLLQNISSLLIHEENVDTLYTKLIDAAQTIMRSDFASMQIYYPDTETSGRLRLLATSGFNEDSKKFWEWVSTTSGTTCSAALRTGKRFITSDIQNCECVVGTPDHAMFAKAGVFSAQTTPLFSRNGKLLGMISTHWKQYHTPTDRDLNLLDILARQAADLIERKTAEEALLQSKAALTAADNRKDEFLATLAHELRNPLAPIRNAVHLLRTSSTGGNTQELLAMMDRQVSHLVRLIDDLLDVSRISQGKIDLRKEKITLQNAVSEAIEASRPLIENSGHILTIDLQEEPLWIHADITRIAQIVGNLLNNAAKYTPQGGHITLMAKTEKDRAVLSITDTGLGIPPDMLSNVFDLFTQIDRHLNRAQGGIGIGLALVKRLLEMHDGTIEAKSLGINQGSTFTISIPLAAKPEQQSVKIPENLKDIPVIAKGLSVLVVDDNLPAAQTIGWLLELDGHTPTLAHDAANALSTARKIRPDVILLDIGLPDISGYDVCRELRKDPQFKNTLIIAQTGWGQDRDRQLAEEAGFSHHLVKPLQTEQLAALLSAESALKYSAHSKLI